MCVSNIVKSHNPDFPRDIDATIFQLFHQSGGGRIVAAMLNGGLALEWVRRVLRFSWDEFYARLDERGLEKPLDLLFVPYLSGERTPHMDSMARGSWVGLSLHHGTDDLAFAALLGVAMSVRLGFEVLQQAADVPLTAARLVGGSAKYPIWRRILAATLRREILVSDVANSSALGAVRLAAVGVNGDDVVSQAEFSTEPVVEVPWIEDYYRWFLAASDPARSRPSPV